MNDFNPNDIPRMLGNLSSSPEADTIRRAIEHMKDNPMPPVDSIQTMHSVRVSVPKLIETMKANRDSHVEEYNEAIVGWREQVLEKLQENAEAAKTAADDDALTVLMSVHLPKPRSHAEEYDRVIGMLEYGLAEEIELTAAEFAQYGQDNWAWQGQFRATTQNYKKM